MRLPHYNLQFTGPVFDALIPALVASSSTVAELARRPELARYGAPKICDALLRMTALSDQILPMARSTDPALGAQTPDPAGLYRVPLAFNRTLLEQRLTKKSLVALASPLSGTGHVLPMLQAVCLRLLTTVEPAARPAWIRAFVARQPPSQLSTTATAPSPIVPSRPASSKTSSPSSTTNKLPELLWLGIVEG